jgi:hypothetical protein
MDAMCLRCVKGCGGVFGDHPLDQVPEKVEELEQGVLEMLRGQQSGGNPQDGRTVGHYVLKKNVQVEVGSVIQYRQIYFPVIPDATNGDNALDCTLCKTRLGLGHAVLKCLPRKDKGMSGDSNEVQSEAAEEDLYSWNARWKDMGLELMCEDCTDKYSKCQCNL